MPIILYTTSLASSVKVTTECRRMKDLLAAKQMKIKFTFEEVDVSTSIESKEQMQKTGKQIAPVLVIDGKAYTFEEVSDLNEMEELDDLLRMAA